MDSFPSMASSKQPVFTNAFEIAMSSKATKESKGRRLSKATTRSRSNTMNSTSSSLESPAPSMSSGEEAVNLSPKSREETSTAPHEEQRQSVKALLSRGQRILKRQGSKFNLLTLNEEQHLDDVTSFDDRPEPVRARNRPSLSRASVAKKHISRPFDFQHVVHTDREDFERLEKETKDEWDGAVGYDRKGSQSSQVSPRRRPEELSFDTVPEASEDSNEWASVSPKTPPPRHPGRITPTGASGNDTVTGARMSRSIENFSRPGVRSPQSVMFSPNSRISHSAFVGPEAGSPPVSAIESMGSIMAVSSVTPAPVLEDLPVGHAVTTVDDSARVMIQKPLPSVFQSDLVPLVEESEGSSVERSSPPISPKTNPRLSIRNSLKHVQSSPSLTTPVEQTTAQPLPALPLRRISSIDEDPIPMPDASYTTPDQPHYIDGSRFSIGLSRPLNVDSWEDDIDYCYEHAAEADCDFEWSRRSNELDRAAIDVGEVVHGDMSGRLQPSPIAEQQANVVSRVRQTNPRSTHSASTYSDVLTPHTLHEDRSSIGAFALPDGMDPEDPTIYNHDPLGDDVVDMYSDMLVDEKGFHAYSHMDRSVPALSVASSGSNSSMSKYHSQESIILSRAASIVRTHRSSNSIGSLPELIHSTGTLDSNDPQSTLQRNQSSSKLSLMRTPSLTSGATNLTARSSLREQISIDQIRSESPVEPSMPIAAESEVLRGLTNPELPIPTAKQMDHALEINASIPLRSSSSRHGHQARAASESVSNNKPADYQHPTGASFAARMRANSASTSRMLPRRPSNRVSYSLFPSAGAGPKTPPVINQEMGNFF